MRALIDGTKKPRLLTPHSRSEVQNDWEDGERKEPAITGDEGVEVVERPEDDRRYRDEPCKSRPIG